ncbi:MAG: alpha-mannosidase [Massiliimalia sp.]|jgi:alpha-mannosidase
MKKLHMIGNAHLDPVWLWRWQEGFQENKATLKSALDRLNEYDDVVFTSSSAQFYEWVEENDPEMFEKIRHRVQEGRWVICGGWWIQPDCNLPGGESFARHALLAQNYFKEKFGVIATVGYNVDSFGHNGMIPQLLNLSGMKYYVFMRPGPHEKGLPGRHFIWRSSDGSQVTAYQIPFSYCTFGSLQKHMEACMQDFDPNVDCLMCFYGVGNHGGGPTIENIETIRSIQNNYPDVEIVFSDPVRYFKELDEKRYSLPVVSEDLQHHASGCYSVQSEIKSMNRRSEQVLLRAEKWASVSSAMGESKYPDRFSDGWKRVLFNQFHDILAGSSIVDAYEDSRNEHGEALSIAARGENNALQAIAFHIGIEQDTNMLPVVVFNPHSWDMESPVEIEIGQFANQKIGSVIDVVDADGKPVACQQIASNAKANGRTRIVFRAKVPALGYQVFRLYGDRVEACNFVDTAASNVLENQWIRVKIDEKTGGIQSIYDKQTDTEFLKDTGALPIIIQDDSDTWSHGITRFDQEIGQFVPVSVKKTEAGQVRSSIRVISKYGNSTMVQTFTLYADSRDVDVSVRLNWQEKFKCLKLKFPVNLDQYRATYEIPFGTVSKECNGEEEPMQKWFDLTGMKPGNKTVCGLSIINENKYSANVTRNVMAMTVLRSPVYAHHEPFVLEDEIEDYQFVDQGIQNFRYQIVPHMGTWKEARIVRKGCELNQPYTAIIETYHKGHLPQKAQNIRIDVPNVIISALKQADHLDAYILRVYETDGVPTKATIDLPLFGKKITASMRGNEIKTFAIDRKPDTIPYEVNLLEWEVE